MCLFRFATRLRRLTFKTRLRHEPLTVKPGTATYVCLFCICRAVSPDMNSTTTRTTAATNETLRFLRLPSHSNCLCVICNEILWLLSPRLAFPFHSFCFVSILGFSSFRKWILWQAFPLLMFHTSLVRVRYGRSKNNCSIQCGVLVEVNRDRLHNSIKS